jgi:hypothetical protein
MAHSIVFRGYRINIFETDNGWSYDFVVDGSLYSDYQFTTWQLAETVARKKVKAALRKASKVIKGHV